MPSFTHCLCSLTDCHFWHQGPTTSRDDCNCSHPEKQHYMVRPCPLYRKEWQNRDVNAENLKARFLKKRI